MADLLLITSLQGLSLQLWLLHICVLRCVALVISLFLLTWDPWFFNFFLYAPLLWWFLNNHYLYFVCVCVWVCVVILVSPFNIPELIVQLVACTIPIIYIWFLSLHYYAPYQTQMIGSRGATLSQGFSCYVYFCMHVHVLPSYIFCC